MADWSSLPGDLLVLIAQRLASMEDLLSFSASCKDLSLSIKLFMPEKNKLLVFPPRSACLMLSDNVNDMVTLSQQIKKQSRSEDKVIDMVTLSHKIKQRRSENIKPRNFFKLSSGKTYESELPEASGRRCLGVGHGWVLTVGVDLNINLLLPFSRKQIPLPPTLALPEHYVYDKDECRSTIYFEMFIEKAALSANPKSSHDRSTSVMMIYGQRRRLAVARLGDKVWTKVLIYSMFFDDVVFYRGKYYIVDFRGVVFVCGLNNDESTSATAIAPTPSQNRIFEEVVLYRGHNYVECRFGYEMVSDLENDKRIKIPSATAIAPTPSATDDWCHKYLVEFSGDLLLVRRIREDINPDQDENSDDENTSELPNHVVFDSEEEEDYEKGERELPEGALYADYSYGNEIQRDNYTIKFSVLKLEEISRCEEDRGGSEYPYGWAKVNSLGNKSLFIVWNQSVSLSASMEGGIKPNCIYFTDDELESFNCKQIWGRDMGIYHMESGITEPLLQSPSLHRYPSILVYLKLSYI